MTTSQAQIQARQITGGGEDGVDPIAVASLEVIAAHEVLSLEMADDGHDRSRPDDAEHRLIECPSGFALWHWQRRRLDGSCRGADRHHVRGRPTKGDQVRGG